MSVWPWLTCTARGLAGVAWGLFFLVALPGCGKAPEEEGPKFEVQGKVIFPGDTKSRLVVTFTSQGAKNQKQYQTPCLPDRTYSLQCPKGKYKVTLAVVPGHGSAPAGQGAVAPAGQMTSIPGRYQDTNASPWEVEVPPGGRKGVDLRVD